MPTNLILTRPATPSPPSVDLPPSFTLHPVTHPSDPAFLFLDRLYASDGFPAGWARQMLERGAQAVVIVQGDAPAASALLIRQPFYVQEIRRTFDPGPDADYYFGDFVAPGFRGRHLQRSLIRARLLMTHQAGRPWALAMTRATPPASLDNYVAEGFAPSAELRSRTFSRWQLDRFRFINRQLPHGKLSQEGFRLPFSHRLRSS